MSSNRLHTIRANTSWLVGVRIFRMFIGVVVLGFVGRYLGPEQFGILNYAMSLVAIFAVVANLGFDGIVIRELVSHPNRSEQILGTAFGLRLAGSSVAVLMVYLLSLCTQDPEKITKLVLIVAVAFFPSSLEVMELWFQKNIQAKHTVIARVTSTLIVSAAKLALVYVQAPLELFASMQALEALLGGLALLWAFRTRGQKISAWRFNFSGARELLRQSWPLIVAGVLISLSVRIDQILVRRFLGDYSVGIYYSALRISDVWSFIPSALLTTIYPILVSKRLDAPEKYQAKLQTIFDILTGMGYAIAILTTLLAEMLIPLIFGEEYRAAVPVLIIQAWTAPIIFSALARAQNMLLENQTRLYMPIAIIGIAINIPLSIFLMDIWGMLGAASAVLIASTCSGYLTSFLFPSLRTCAGLQSKAFLLPFRWRKVFHAIKQLR